MAKKAAKPAKPAVKVKDIDTRKSPKGGATRFIK
jgi:hypothetical protein